MAKLGNRQGKTLVCQDCKEENYVTDKNVKIIDTKELIGTIDKIVYVKKNGVL